MTTVQPKFATRQDFFTALAVREWHWRRLARFSRGKLTADETLKNVASSLRVATALTEILGDGLRIALSEEQVKKLKAAGYKGSLQS